MQWSEWFSYLIFTFIGLRIIKIKPILNNGRIILQIRELKGVFFGSSTWDEIPAFIQVVGIAGFIGFQRLL